MLLSVQELQTIITGKLEKDNIQIHSIDLNVIKIESFDSLTIGNIPKEGKTSLVKYIPTLFNDNHWYLNPGVYNIEFEQGCSLKNNTMLLIRQRSSLLRNGSVIHSSIFDAEFTTKSIGCIMVVNHPIKIEFGARIATIYGHSCSPVDKGYSGQWSNDNQRNQK